MPARRRGTSANLKNQIPESRLGTSPIRPLSGPARSIWSPRGGRKCAHKYAGGFRVQLGCQGKCLWTLYAHSRLRAGTRPRHRCHRRRGFRFTPPPPRHSTRLPIRETVSSPLRTSVKSCRWNYVRNDTAHCVASRARTSPLSILPSENTHRGRRRGTPPSFP